MVPVPAEQITCTREAPSLWGGGQDGARVAAMRPGWWLWGSMCFPRKHWCCGVESVPSGSASFLAAPPQSVAGATEQCRLCRWDNTWADSPVGLGDDCHPCALPWGQVCVQCQCAGAVPSQSVVLRLRGDEEAPAPLGLWGRCCNVWPRARSWRILVASAREVAVTVLWHLGVPLWCGLLLLQGAVPLLRGAGVHWGTCHGFAGAGGLKPRCRVWLGSLTWQDGARCWHTGRPGSPPGPTKLPGMFLVLI